MWSAISRRCRTSSPVCRTHGSGSHRRSGSPPTLNAPKASKHRPRCWLKKPGSEPISGWRRSKVATGVPKFAALSETSITRRRTRQDPRRPGAETDMDTPTPPERGDLDRFRRLGRKWPPKRSRRRNSAKSWRASGHRSQGQGTSARPERGVDPRRRGRSGPARVGAGLDDLEQRFDDDGESRRIPR